MGIDSASPSQSGSLDSRESESRGSKESKPAVRSVRALSDTGKRSRKFQG